VYLDVDHLWDVADTILL